MQSNFPAVHKIPEAEFLTAYPIERRNRAMSTALVPPIRKTEEENFHFKRTND